jgi:hypothetical protein
LALQAGRPKQPWRPCRSRRRGRARGAAIHSDGSRTGLAGAALADSSYGSADKPLAGPGQGFGVVGLIKTDDTLANTARSLAGAWLRVCCINQAPGCLATKSVTVAGTIEGLPIAP